MCSAKYLLCFRNAQATSGLTGRDETTAAPDGIQGSQARDLGRRRQVRRRRKQSRDACDARGLEREAPTESVTALGRGGGSRARDWRVGAGLMFQRPETPRTARAGRNQRRHCSIALENGQTRSLARVHAGQGGLVCGRHGPDALLVRAALSQPSRDFGLGTRATYDCCANSWRIRSRPPALSRSRRSRGRRRRVPRPLGRTGRISLGAPTLKSEGARHRRVRPSDTGH